MHARRVKPGKIIYKYDINRPTPMRARSCITRGVTHSSSRYSSCLDCFAFYLPTPTRTGREFQVVARWLVFDFKTTRKRNTKHVSEFSRTTILAKCCATAAGFEDARARTSSKEAQYRNSWMPETLTRHHTKEVSYVQLM